MYQEGFRDRGDFSGGMTHRQSCSQKLLNWLSVPALKYKKLFVYKQRETKVLHGYFHWLNTLIPMQDCVGRGQLITLRWLALFGRWWIRSKGTVQQSPYLFFLAANAEWQWRLAAAQMDVWRFPHTSIPPNHKTHLLTLNWHTWEGFPRGEQGRRRMWRKRQKSKQKKIK